MLCDALQPVIEAQPNLFTPFVNTSTPVYTPVFSPGKIPFSSVV